MRERFLFCLRSALASTALSIFLLGCPPVESTGDGGIDAGPGAGSNDAGAQDSGTHGGEPDSGTDAGVAGNFSLHLTGFAAGKPIYLKLKNPSGTATYGAMVSGTLDGAGSATLVIPSVLRDGVPYGGNFYTDNLPDVPNAAYDPPLDTFTCGDHGWRLPIVGSSAGVNVELVDDGGCTDLSPW